MKMSFFANKRVIVSQLISRQLRNNCRTLVSDVNSKSKFYDIIIVGGGMVGTVLACSISKTNKLSGQKVLLLEGAPAFKGFSGSGNYSNRVSALNKGTKSLMMSACIWDTITNTRFKSVKRMQVWDAVSDAIINFSNDDAKEDVCYIVENDLIIDSALKCLEGVDNIDIQYCSKIESCVLGRDNDTKMSLVTLKSGESFGCDLLIGADGVNSLVRQQMDCQTFSTAYNQMGVVATVELAEAGENSIAWQRFLPTGPVALLPLSKTLSSVVWTTTPEHAKELIKMSSEDFVNELNAAYAQEYPRDNLTDKVMRGFNSFMGTAESINQLPPAVLNVADNSRASFPLGFGMSSTYACQGSVLIGDAAHRVHPLAGQGVNLGFGDIAVLIDVLSEAAYSGANIGDINYLLKYQGSRLKNNVPIMLGIHGIQTLFNSSVSPIVMARSLGLQVTNSFPFLKKLFTKKAMA